MRKLNFINFENEKCLEDICGLIYVMILMKGWWIINVMWWIYNGVNCYGLFKKEIEGILEKMLI